VKMRNPLAELVQQTGGAQNRRAGFHGWFGAVSFCTVYRPQALATSHFQEETVPRTCRTVRCVPKVLWDTLR
jgi:hypothetical protein